MARASLSNWFLSHPVALAATLKWLKDKRSGKTTESLASFVRWMERPDRHRFPFAVNTLQVWLSKNEPTLYAAAIATKKPRKAKSTRPAAESFARSGSDLAKIARREDFIVTSAVNNCAADPGFLAACERWREERQGVIVANPIKYKNPTRREDEDKERAERWWDSNLHPYLLEEEIRPHPLLSLMTTKAQATVSNPLPARLDGRTKARSAIFGHPQVAMRSVATPQNKLPKLLYSSGAITVPSYSDTIAGDMGNFHHSLAGIIAEVRGDRFHLREVMWDGEKFLDLDRAYYADRIEDAPSPAALVMGDIHVGETAANVMDATFGEFGMIPVLAPDRVVLHDLGNGVSVNPHEANSRLTRAAQALRGETNLQLELEEISNWLGALPAGPSYHVIPSNHDEFLDRWLERGENGVESENLALYHELAAGMLRVEQETGEFPMALELALRGETPFDRGDVQFHKLDAPFQVEGVELGMHGNRGSNGARGSAAGFARLGVRSMVGHSHSPTIWQGCYVVGTSSEYRLSYNKGPSSWFQTHGLVHANGYRQLVHMIDDHWHG